MMSALTERFGANLSRARIERQLSQEGLMLRADVHRTQISKYERGETEPQLEILARLAGALGVTADSLLAGVRWRESPPGLEIEPPGLETESSRTERAGRPRGGQYRRRHQRSRPPIEVIVE